jgi:HrpA-like RNA helicase
VAEVALQLARDTKAKVLAFHPGKREIAATATSIEKLQATVPEDERVAVVPLHGQLTAEEQSKAFEPYPYGAVVATTNAAETSLTVPDAIAVVDGGEVRVDRMRYDLIASGTQGLYLENAPQANLDQRAGRVGRTQDGVYVACTQDGGMFPVPYEDRPEYATPSIQRSSLDGLLLHLKATGYEFTDFSFFHAVPEEAVKAAAYRLYNLGAIDEQGHITERGKRMERLPLDPEYACMVVFAYENDYNAEVKRNVLDIAAIMQRGGVLGRAPKEQKWRDLLAQNKRGEVLEADGDYFAQLEAYIELLHHVDVEDWASYDINEHTASLVEQDRESLARVLGVSLHAPRVVAPSHRRSVLTCIHAGQINQIWRRSGELWSLLIGPRAEYQLTASSVVQNVGELVTGSLFSLGIGEKTYNTVQNVHVVQDYDSLATAAGHLVKRVYAKDSAVYDPERGALVVAVEHKLGSLVLRTTYEELDARADTLQIDAVRQGYADHAWNTWEGRKEQAAPLTMEATDIAIEQPESRQYATDPVTDEPLLAWRGGKGQWVRTKEIAIESLRAHRAQLQKQPRKQELREIKADVKTMRSRLIAASRRADKPTADTVKSLLARAANTREWLEEAAKFFEPTEL